MPYLRLTTAFICFALLCSGQQAKTRNVFFVMSDGLRWQEIYSGADRALMPTREGREETELRREFWRETAQERREALLPFLWTVVAKQGQLYGNREAGSEAYVTNGFNFSYPGYSEILCGFPDPRVDSNEKRPNPNVTVLEWLHQKAAFKGKVAAFGAWDTFPAIINRDRAGFLVNAGYETLEVPPITPKLEILNRLKADTGIWGGEPFDATMFYTALEYLKAHKPRVLFISLGDTDEWAHAGNYSLYLKAVHRADQFLRQLWETAQSLPEYKGSTTLIVATDHGRGLAPVEWRSHGQKVPDSKNVWYGFMGPDTPALGERRNVEPVTQNQIAATLARFLGEDYDAAVPKAGKPVAGVFAAK